jgi:hypothetical protein
MSSHNLSTRLPSGQSYPALQTLVQPVPVYPSNNPPLAAGGGFERLFGGEVADRVRRRPTSVQSNGASNREAFNRIDVNNDGVIDFAEFEAAAERTTPLARPGSNNNGPQLSNDQWAAQMMKEMQMVERALSPNRFGRKQTVVPTTKTTNPTNLPPVGPGAVRTVLVLEGSLDQLPVPRRPWDDAVCADVATAIGTRPERVMVAGVQQGSVLVWLDLLPGGPLEATAQELAGTFVAAVADSSSRLHTGATTKPLNRGETLSRLASLGPAPLTSSNPISAVTVDNSLAVRRSVQAVYVAVNHWKQHQTLLGLRGWRAVTSQRKRRRLSALQGTFKWRHDQVAHAVVLWWKVRPHCCAIDCCACFGTEICCQVCMVERDSANMVDWVVAYGSGQVL